MYFKVNKKYLGIYEIYCVNIEIGEYEILIELNGMMDYVLSFGEDVLLLIYFKVI